MPQLPVRRASERLAMRRATVPGSRAALALLVLALSCAGPRPAPPRAAEERIAAGDVGRDVAWLADPARTGRGVGTPGNEEAARWIAARMRHLGLEPVGSDGYLQPFDAPVGARLAGENALRIGGHDLVTGTAWQPFTFSDDGVVNAELVWVGHGITAPDLGHDDYAGIDVKGKIVLVAAHAPGEKDPSSPWRDPRRFHYGEWRYKAANARDHGAAAVIVVRDAWNHPGPDTLEPWRGGVSSRAGIVAARVTSDALSRAGIDALALAGGGDRPASRGLAQRARLSVHVVHETARTSNVLGALPGTDPRAGCVVVGAHFDHLGFGGEASLAPGSHAVHPGADDNASGVAAMLAVARAMQQDRPRRTVLFAAFSGEELGLLGSAQVVRAPPPSCPIDAMQLMVNLDMVGRPQGGKLYVQGAGTAVGERDRIATLATEAPPIPLTLAFGGDDGYGPSDHTSFHARGVPIVFFFTGAHADYHRPSDTADKIDARGLASVARLAYRTARAAADAPDRYVAVRTSPPPGSQATVGERSAGYGAYLGSIPDFSERSERGVLVSAVRPGSPAEVAGVRGGDVLLALGAAQLATLQDLAYALRSHRPGDRVELVWQRGGDTLRADVTLTERK